MRHRRLASRAWTLRARFWLPRPSKFPILYSPRLNIGIASRANSMAFASLLPSLLQSSLCRSLDSSGRQRRHRGLGVAASRSIKFRAAREVSTDTISSRFSPLGLGFSGLRKMSTSEGLSKRARDPQLVKDEATDRVAKTRSYVSSQMSKPGVKSLAIAVGIPLLLGSINAIFNSPFSKWFSDLKKPWWEPPGPIFGGAWSLLYPLMGLASWLVWAEGGFHKQSTPLTLYVSQLVLNLMWPLFFFGWKKLGLALVDIIILDGVLAATISSFQSVNHVAANLLKPYLAWVLFATVLNFNLWLNNRGGAHQPAQ